jgi:D-glycero-beta-D-manno-heptose 1-phosphate adenylyltransferase
MLSKITIDSKIKNLDDLKTQRETFRKEKKKVVFANGCFDILHVGHTRYLNEAKKMGDVLIVGLNSDRSIKKIKGANKPIVSEKDRERVIASLQAVDYVFLFNEERVDSILLQLEPDIHVKGTDYTEMTVPERETVISYGGKVAIAGDPKSHSTKFVIERIIKVFKSDKLDK